MLGCTAFTRIFQSAYSIAAALVSPRRPHFDAL
jgi:hypothetical protein